MNVFANRFVFVRLVCESFRFLFIFESFRLFVSATIKKNRVRVCAENRFANRFVCSFANRFVFVRLVCESFRVFSFANRFVCSFVFAK